MSNKNATYNLDIHPYVERITLVCKQENIPGFMLFQDDEDQFRVSGCNIDESIVKMLVNYLFQLLSERQDLTEAITEAMISNFIEALTNSEPTKADLDSFKLSGSFDHLISKMITLGQLRGHNSKLLTSLGIPRSPDPSGLELDASSKA